MAAVALLTLAFNACSETDNTTDEFPNWQAANEAYFDSVYNVAKANATQWQVLPSLSLAPEAVKNNTDNVAVQVIETGSGSERAMQNDTVRVILQGRLKASPGYPRKGVPPNVRGKRRQNHGQRVENSGPQNRFGTANGLTANARWCQVAHICTLSVGLRLCNRQRNGGAFQCCRAGSGLLHAHLYH